MSKAKTKAKEDEPTTVTVRARKMLMAMWGARIQSSAAQDAALEGADELGNIPKRYLTLANESELGVKAAQKALHDIEAEVREEEYQAAQFPIVQMQDRVAELQQIAAEAEQQIETGDIAEADSWQVRAHRAEQQITNLSRRIATQGEAIKTEFFGDVRRWKLGLWDVCGKLLMERPWAIEPLSAGLAFAEFADTFSEEVLAEGVQSISGGRTELRWCELTLEQIMVPAMARGIKYEEKDTEGIRLAGRDGIRDSFLESRLWLRTATYPCNPYKDKHGSPFGKRSNFAVLVRRNTSRPNDLRDVWDPAIEGEVISDAFGQWRGTGIEAAKAMPSKW